MKGDAKFCDNAELTAWEAAALPLSRLTYYEGRSLGRELENPSAIAVDVINRIRTLYNLGRITLFQRRLSAGPSSTFAYTAVFLERPAKAIGQRLPLVPLMDELEAA